MYSTSRVETCCPSWSALPRQHTPLCLDDHPSPTALGTDLAHWDVGDWRDTALTCVDSVAAGFLRDSAGSTSLASAGALSSRDTSSALVLRVCAVPNTIQSPRQLPVTLRPRGTHEHTQAPVPNDKTRLPRLISREAAHD
jgi:hypothetical protein